MKMKKSIFLTIAAVVVLGLASLTSCKGNKSESTEQNKDSLINNTSKEVVKDSMTKPAEEKPAATEEKK